MKMRVVGTGLSLATRSDFPLEAQISASGATWIDRQLLARQPATSGNAFGVEVREAMDRHVNHLVEGGLARRQGQRVVFARDLLDTLRQRELDEVSARVAAETGLAHRPSAEGEHVAGIYRQRVSWLAIHASDFERRRALASCTRLLTTLQTHQFPDIDANTSVPIVSR